MANTSPASSTTVSIKITSIVLQTSEVARLCSNTSPVKIFFKLISFCDLVEGVNTETVLDAATPFLSLRFNTVSYQLKILEKTDPIIIQLFDAEMVNQKIAEAQFKLPDMQPGDKGRPVTINFAAKSADTLGGVITIETKLNKQGGEDIIVMNFKRNVVDLNQLEAESKRKVVPNAQGSISKKKQPFKFFKSGSNKQRKNRKFGVRLDPTYDEVPEIMVQTIVALSATAIQLKGIFRESAPAGEVEEHIRKFETGREPIWENVENQHVVAGVLMSYLLRLPEPIITFDLYEGLIAAEETVQVREERVDLVSKLIKTLPTGNRNALRYLIEYLARLSKHADAHKMSPRNLGIVFGPALMRKEVEDVKQIIADSPLVINIVSMIIEEYEFIFEGGAQKGSSEDMSRSPPQTVAIDKDMQEIEATQETVFASLTSIKQNITMLIADLENASAITVLDIKRLSSLVFKFHTLIDNPHTDDAALEVDVMPESVALNIRLRSKELQRAFTMILERILICENALKETVLFQDIDTCKTQTENMKLLSSRLSQLLDQNEVAKENKDNQLRTARLIIGTISEKLKSYYITQLKNELTTHQSLPSAIAIARVVRAVKNALKDQTVEPLSEKVCRIAPNIDQTLSNSLNEQKLAAVNEVMNYAFTEIVSRLTAIQSKTTAIQSVMESRALVQLLVGIKKFIDAFLSSTPLDTAPADAPPFSPANSNNNILSTATATMNTPLTDSTNNENDTTSNNNNNNSANSSNNSSTNNSTNNSSNSVNSTTSNKMNSPATSSAVKYEQVIVRRPAPTSNGPASCSPVRKPAPVRNRVVAGSAATVTLQQQQASTNLFAGRAGSQGAIVTATNNNSKYEKVGVENDQSDTNFPTVKYQATCAFAEFRNLLNSLLIDYNNISNSDPVKLIHLAAMVDAAKKLISGEKKEEVISTIRKHISSGTLHRPDSIRCQRLKSLISTTLDDLRGFMFQMNCTLATAKTTDELTPKIEQLNALIDIFKTEE